VGKTPPEPEPRTALERIAASTPAVLDALEVDVDATRAERPQLGSSCSLRVSPDAAVPSTRSGTFRSTDTPRNWTHLGPADEVRGNAH